MDHQRPEYPKARRSGVLVDHVRDETIVYDESRQEAHALNRAASVVWEHSDGTRSVGQLASVLGAELGTEPNESVVEYALDELSRVHLLDTEAAVDAPDVSRRDALRKLTVAGVSVIAIPVVLSIVAPTPAMAASGTQNSQGQNNNNQG